MSIFLTHGSRVLVQGMTGSEGTIHTSRMLAAGTTVVGGVNPRKAGLVQAFPGVASDSPVEVPVFGTVAEAREVTGADVSVVFVPPAFAKAAVDEAVDAQMRLVVVITEGIPVADTTAFVAHAAEAGVRIIGPNCPGVITPGVITPGVGSTGPGAAAGHLTCDVGIIPADITGPGPVGLVSKSGTLTYQMMYELRDLGFTTCVGIGGDPVVGTTHIDALAAFEADPDTEVVVMIGEIGGDAEERAAQYVAEHMSTPVVAYVAGFTAPPGRTMGHAGAIVSGSSGTAQAKKKALEAVGVQVGRTPSETAALVRALRRS